MSPWTASTAGARQAPGAKHVARKIWGSEKTPIVHSRGVSYSLAHPTVGFTNTTSSRVHSKSVPHYDKLLVPEV
jgi:hypothetical protein